MAREQTLSDVLTKYARNIVVFVDGAYEANVGGYSFRIEPLTVAGNDGFLLTPITQGLYKMVFTNLGEIENFIRRLAQ